jgi:hypothetical protein
MVLDIKLAQLPVRCRVRPELCVFRALAHMASASQQAQQLSAGLQVGGGPGSWCGWMATMCCWWRSARRRSWTARQHSPAAPLMSCLSSTWPMAAPSQAGCGPASCCLFPLFSACHHCAAVLSSFRQDALCDGRQCGHPLLCAAEVQLPHGQQVRALPAEGSAPALLQLQDGALAEFRDGALVRLASSSFPAPCPLMARIPAGAAGGHRVACGVHCHLAARCRPTQSRQRSTVGTA